MALLDQYGRAVKRRVLSEEVAAAQTVGVRSPISGYPGDGLNPARLANILREADQGDPLRFFELAETMEERDPHYAGVLGTRRRSVAQIDITVESASDEARDVAMADMVRDWLLRDELSEELFDILDAIGKGISLTEIIWDSSMGQWQPARLELRDPRWFTFDRTDLRTPMMQTEAGPVPLPGYKFITTTIKAKSGLPVRSGIARIAAWSYMFKAFTSRDWAIFTQTFGQPIRVGKYGPNTSDDDKETLWRAVANIAGDCAAIVPDSMLIEFIENKTVGASSDLYLKRVDHLDQQVSKAVLGQTTTTDAISGGHAVSREHREVQGDIERSDAKALSGILNRDLIRPWINLEYGPQAKYPRIVIGRPEEKDVKLIVESVERLVPLGLRVAQSTMTDLLGLPDADPDDMLLGAPAAPPAPVVPFAKPSLQATGAGEDLPGGEDPSDMLVEGAEAVSAKAMDGMIDTVRTLLDDVDTLEAFRDRLLEIYADMDEEQMATALQMAFAWADLLGRDDLG
ncbi:MAG: DUF935 domain-containing protein [Paracoccaceae bacterium]